MADLPIIPESEDEDDHHPDEDERKQHEYAGDPADFRSGGRIAAFEIAGDRAAEKRGERNEREDGADDRPDDRVD